LLPGILGLALLVAGPAPPIEIVQRLARQALIAVSDAADLAAPGAILPSTSLIQPIHRSYGLVKNGTVAPIGLLSGPRVHAPVWPLKKMKSPSKKSPPGSRSR
jgi:hypothetical protein